MPSYAGKIPEEDMTGILDYLVSLTGDEQSGEEPTEDKAEEADKPEEKVLAEESTAPAAAEEPASPAERGEALAAQNGCLGCHSVDGSKRVGPTLKGFWGSERIVTRDGQETTLVADDNYLRKALREPSLDVVQGYPPAMPPFPGLSDEEIQDLRSWLETLK
jgi:cytochrome c551/c552